MNKIERQNIVELIGKAIDEVALPHELIELENRIQHDPEVEKLYEDLAQIHFLLGELGARRSNENLQSLIGKTLDRVATPSEISILEQNIQNDVKAEAEYEGHAQVHSLLKELGEIKQNEQRLTPNTGQSTRQGDSLVHLSIPNKKKQLLQPLVSIVLAAMLLISIGVATAIFRAKSSADIQLAESIDKQNMLDKELSKLKKERLESNVELVNHYNEIAEIRLGVLFPDSEYSPRLEDPKWQLEDVKHSLNNAKTILEKSDLSQAKSLLSPHIKRTHQNLARFHFAMGTGRNIQALNDYGLCNINKQPLDNEDRLHLEKAKQHLNIAMAISPRERQYKYFDLKINLAMDKKANAFQITNSLAEDSLFKWDARFYKCVLLYEINNDSIAAKKELVAVLQTFDEKIEWATTTQFATDTNDVELLSKKLQAMARVTPNPLVYLVHERLDDIQTIEKG